jgi:SAM-dependent methyltransferase
LISCDLYPYKDVDLVCDLTKGLPLKSGSFDAVHLSNVLEHVQRPMEFMKTVADKLKRGGRLIAMVPFLTGEHQIPYDFHRYTRYGIKSLVETAGLSLEEILSWGDSLQLCSQLGWDAVRKLPELKNGWGLKGRMYASALGAALRIVARVSRSVRTAANVGFINSPLGDVSVYGFMFIAKKER